MMQIRLFDFGFGRARHADVNQEEPDEDWSEGYDDPIPDAPVPQDNVALAGELYRGFADNDRTAVEALLAKDLRFTSPYDNGLDRAAWFARCWPEAEAVTDFQFIHVAASADVVFVTYEGERATGGRFRNTEILTFRHGQVTDVEVYFGWNIPHDAPAGGFVEPGDL